MKALLVLPPDTHMIRTNVPSVVDEETGCYPPIGLLYVASYARKNSSHEIDVLDAVAQRLDYDQIEREVRKRRPDVVGIQTLTFSLCDAILTAQCVKRVSSDIKIVLGGPHVFLFPDESLRIPEIDYIVLGEGEATFCELLDALDKEKSPADVKGIAFRESEKIIRTEPRPLVENLDVLPHPERELLPIGRYRSILSRGAIATTLISSRGCPFRCVFCSRPHLGKKFRARSPQNVFDEMKRCKDLGIDEIMFYDDTFTIDRERALELCRLIREKRLDILWDIRAHVNTLDERLLKRLKQAGCTRIHLGIESGNERVLRALRKNIKLDRALAIIKAARRLGIETLGYFIVGNPSETESEIQDSLRFALSADLDFIHVSVMMPFPGTELYQMGLSKGLFPHDHWKEYARNPSPDFVPETWNEHLSAEELNRWMLKMYKKFYGRPRYIARSILKVRSPGQLLKRAKAGYRLLTFRG